MLIFVAHCTSTRHKFTHGTSTQRFATYPRRPSTRRPGLNTVRRCGFFPRRVPYGSATYRLFFQRNVRQRIATWGAFPLRNAWCLFVFRCGVGLRCFTWFFASYRARVTVKGGAGLYFAATSCTVRYRVLMWLHIMSRRLPWRIVTFVPFRWRGVA